MCLTPDVVNPSERGALPQCPFETRDRVGISLRDRFDAAVIKISDEPGQPLASRRIFGEKAEADALDEPTHEKTARDNHRVLKNG